MSTACCCNQEDWVTRPQNGVSIVISKLTAYRSCCLPLAALATSSKTRQKLAATWRRLSFLWLHLDCLCLPVELLVIHRRRQRRKINQAWKSSALSTPPWAPPNSNRPDPLSAANRPHFQFIKWHLFGALGSMDMSTISYTGICLDIFAPMAPKHQFLISLAWRGPRAPLWFFIICFSNLHLPVLCFGYSTRHFPVHGLPIWILNDYWFFPAFFHSYFRFPSCFFLAFFLFFLVEFCLSLAHFVAF